MIEDINIKINLDIGFSDIEKTFKFFSKLFKTKTPFDTYKSILTQAYLSLIECDDLTKNFVVNIFKTKNFTFPEGRIFDTTNIVESEFFKHITNEIQTSNYGNNIDFEEIKQNIQLKVEEILYYNRYDSNIQGLIDYLEHNYSHEQKKSILRKEYQESLSKKFFENKLNESFIEPTFANGFGNLTDLYNDLEKKNHFFILTHKKQGKTTIAYKILSDKLYQFQYYLDFVDLELSSESPAENYKKLKMQISRNIGLDINNNFVLNGLVVIDNLTNIDFLDKFINLLESEYCKDLKIIVFLPNFKRIEEKIDDDRFEIRKLESPEIKKFAYDIDKSIEEFKKLSTDKRNELINIAHKLYMDRDIELNKEVGFHSKFYISREFRDYLSSESVK